MTYNIVCSVRTFINKTSSNTHPLMGLCNILGYDSANKPLETLCFPPFCCFTININNFYLGGGLTNYIESYTTLNDAKGYFQTNYQCSPTVIFQNCGHKNSILKYFFNSQNNAHSFVLVYQLKRYLQR